MPDVVLWLLHCLSDLLSIHKQAAWCWSFPDNGLPDRKSPDVPSQGNLFSSQPCRGEQLLLFAQVYFLKMAFETRLPLLFLSDPLNMQSWSVFLFPEKPVHAQKHCHRSCRLCLPPLHWSEPVLQKSHTLSDNNESGHPLCKLRFFRRVSPFFRPHLWLFQLLLFYSFMSVS